MATTQASEAERMARRFASRAIGSKARNVDWIVQDACPPPRHPPAPHDPLLQVARGKDESAGEPGIEWRRQTADFLDVEEQREGNALRACDHRHRPEFAREIADQPRGTELMTGLGELSLRLPSVARFEGGVA